MYSAIRFLQILLARTSGTAARRSRKRRSASVFECHDRRRLIEPPILYLDGAIRGVYREQAMAGVNQWLDNGGDAGLENFQPRPEAERIERRAQIAGVLPEVRPAVGVQRDDHGIRKRPRGFDGVVGIHGEMERAAGLRRAREWQHHAGLEAPRDFGDAVIPNRIAADVDRTDVVVLSGSAQSR